MINKINKKTFSLLYLMIGLTTQAPVIGMEPGEEEFGSISEAIINQDQARSFPKEVKLLGDNKSLTDATLIEKINIAYSNHGSTEENLCQILDQDCITHLNQLVKTEEKLPFTLGENNRHVCLLGPYKNNILTIPSKMQLDTLFIPSSSGINLIYMQDKDLLLKGINIKKSFQDLAILKWEDLSKGKNKNLAIHIVKTPSGKNIILSALDNMKQSFMCNNYEDYIKIVKDPLRVANPSTITQPQGKTPKPKEERRDEEEYGKKRRPGIEGAFQKGRDFLKETAPQSVKIIINEVLGGKELEKISQKGRDFLKENVPQSIKTFVNENGGKKLEKEVKRIVKNIKKFFKF